jgi:hypothetical protein
MSPSASTFVPITDFPLGSFGGFGDAVLESNATSVGTPFELNLVIFLPSPNWKSPT